MQYFLGMKLKCPPEHRSQTSVVYLPKDHSGIKSKGKDEWVALKFIKYEDHFFREINTWAKYTLHEDFVVHIIRSHNGNTDSIFRAETIWKGFVESVFIVYACCGPNSQSYSYARTYFFEN